MSALFAVLAAGVNRPTVAQTNQVLDNYNSSWVQKLNGRLPAAGSEPMTNADAA